MGSNPSKFKGGDRPVEWVSFFEVQEFIKKLNRQTGKRFRLPTEAEWEYAARGGQDLLYSGSNTIGDVAWYSSNSSTTTHPVATLQPNAWGLYDMSGNVWEWTWDRYSSSYYSNSPSTDPEGPSSGSSRVLRGGSWFNYASYTRVADRNFSGPGYRYDFLGFRLSRTIP